MKIFFADQDTRFINSEVSGSAVAAKVQIFILSSPRVKTRSACTPAQSTHLRLLSNLEFVRSDQLENLYRQ